MIKKAFLCFLATIFHFIPRDEHLWLTGKVTSWGYDANPPQFFDNSKYFYLYLVHKTNEKVYWISSSEKEIALLKSLGLPVVKFKSIKGIFLTLRAKFFFHHYGTDQIMSMFQRGSVQLDFWHGTPLKKIRYDVVPKIERKRKSITEYLDKGAIEFVSSTSEYLSKKIFLRAFDVPMEKILHFGYPRMDVLKLSKSETIEFCKIYSRELLSYIDIAQNHARVFLYMPTWRDDDPDYFMKANVDFEKMSKELEKINGVLFLKLHPLTRFVQIDNYHNIVQINNDVDIYPFLTFTDYLITDYSSIYFDYLPLNKEIIFIPYDYENYIKNRELYFEYDEITAGKKYKTFDDFIRDIKSVDSLDYSNKRKKITDLIIENYNFDACENTYQFIQEKLRNNEI